MGSRAMRWATAAVVLAVVLAVGPAAPAAEPTGPAKKVKAVVLTGGHGYDQKAFAEMLKALEGVEATHVALKDHSEIFEDVSDWPYNVIVLYNMTQRISPKRQKNFLGLLEKGVGLVVLHHALGAWQEWPEFAHGVDYTVHIADPKHPITRGMSDFTIHDETYCRYWVSPDVHVILTTEEPSSGRQIGWTRTWKRARICYLINGHDGKAYGNPNYRRLVTRAILWAAGRLN